MSITEERGRHDVLAGIGMVRQGLDLLLGADGRAWSLTDAQVHDAIVDLSVQANRLEAARLSLVRASVAREDDPNAPRATVQVLKRRCRQTGGRSRADIDNAALTCPTSGTLRSLGAALAQGAVTPAHVDVARRCLTRIPTRLVTAHRELVDAELTRRARDWDSGTAEHLAAHLLSRIAPHASDRYDPEALHRRQLATATDSTGMLLIRGQLDPAGGAKVRSVLDHLSNLNRHLPTPDHNATDPTDQTDQAELVVPDLRTLGQRRADALVTMAALAAEQLNLTTDPETGHHTQGLRPARAVPRIVVQTTPDQLASSPANAAGDDAGPGGCTYSDGGLLDPGTLQRLACDAVIDRVLLSPTGRVLRMDTLGRLATEAQLTALATRDGGCVWPGCAAHAPRSAKRTTSPGGHAAAKP